MNGGSQNKNRIDDSIEQAAQLLSGSPRTVVSTGAGISQECGIPTFRGPDGLWEKFRPEELATREAFLGNPKMAWKWYRERLLTAGETEPNPGHFALAELEKLLPKFLLVTQNVDGLHRRAGSSELIELHGNIGRYRCFEHSHRMEPDPEWGDEPPVCHCGSLIRPDVVWFGEPLPEAELECAFAETARCSVFMLVGSSCLVQPASLLPATAKRAGASLIEVNVSPSEATHLVDVFLQGKSGEILPLIVGRTREILANKKK